MEEDIWRMVTIIEISYQCVTTSFNYAINWLFPGKDTSKRKCFDTIINPSVLSYAWWNINNTDVSLNPTGSKHCIVNLK